VHNGALEVTVWSKSVKKELNRKPFFVSHKRLKFAELRCKQIKTPIFTPHRIKKSLIRDRLAFPKLWLRQA